MDYQTASRPTLRWAAIIAFLWVVGGCDIAGFPLDETARGMVLAFITSLYGIRAIEKVKASA